MLSKAYPKAVWQTVFIQKHMKNIIRKMRMKTPNRKGHCKLLKQNAKLYSVSTRLLIYSVAIRKLGGKRLNFQWKENVHYER